jgi:hypothetical protein
MTKLRLQLRFITPLLVLHDLSFIERRSQDTRAT